MLTFQSALANDKMPELLLLWTPVCLPFPDCLMHLLDMRTHPLAHARRLFFVAKPADVEADDVAEQAVPHLPASCARRPQLLSFLRLPIQGGLLE